MATVEQFVGEAAKEIGYTESPRGSNQNKFAPAAGHLNGQPWCASFLVAIANRVGLWLPGNSAYTPWLADAFRNQGRWSRTPQRGAFAFFDFPDSLYRIQHVGVVESAGGASVTTIDGNTSSGPGGSESNGGGVFRRTRGTGFVVGYGMPVYSSSPLPTPPIKPIPQEKPVPLQPTKVTPVTGGFLVEMTLDGEGHGFAGPMDKVPWKKFSSVEKHAPYPPDQGYGKRPDWDYSVQERDGKLLVVAYGTRGQRVAFHVRLKD